MLLLHDCGSVVAIQDMRYRILDQLEGLPMSAGGQRISVLLIVLVFFRILIPALHPLYEFERDGVALDRQGMVRIALVDIVYLLQVCRRVVG